MKKKAFLEIGKITSLHGIKGFLKLEGWCDDVYIFKSLRHIYLKKTDYEKIRIKDVKFVKNFPLILLENIEEIEEARKLIGKIIHAKREDLKIKEKKLEEGKIYVKLIEGLID